MYVWLSLHWFCTLFCVLWSYFPYYVLPLCSVVAFVNGRIIPKEIQSIRIQNFTPKEYFRLYSSREFQVTINCLKKGNHRQFFYTLQLTKNTIVCSWSNYEFSHIVMQKNHHEWSLWYFENRTQEHTTDKKRIQI